MKTISLIALVLLLTSGVIYYASLPFQSILLSSPFEEAGGNFGRAVDGIGDVDNDGYADLLVGADLEDVAGLSAAGRAYVFSGQTGDTLVALTSEAPQSNGRFGGSVTDLGDVSMDGIPDYAVAAWNEDEAGVTNVGRVYVYSGATHTILYVAKSPVLDSGGSFGVKIAKVGDVSGDGINDMAVGALAQSDAGLSSAGKAYVVSGATGAVVHTLSSPNPETNGAFGNWVADVGDIDGDTMSEIAVGAFFEEPDGSPFAAGRAYVFNGASGNLVYSLHSTNEVSDGFFGGYVAGGGDVDGDGIPDILVGARGEIGSASKSGRLYAFSGDTGDTLFTLLSPFDQLNGQFGSVAGIGDYNMDGYDDFVVGAAGEDNGAGRAYVYDGQTRDTLASFQSPNAEENGFMGARLESAGDVNGDGSNDIIVSAARENPGTSPAESGRAYVFLLGTDTGVGVETTPRSKPVSASNYPNPFDGETSITFSLVNPAHGTVEILDVAGRTIREFVLSSLPSGSHAVSWDGTDQSGLEVRSGIYFYVGRFDGKVLFSGQMVRVR